MRRLIGVIMVLLAICGGVYFGGWICFFKPIAGIIETLIIGGVVTDIAFALFKIFILAPVIEYIACLLIATGLVLIASDD